MQGVQLGQDNGMPMSLEAIVNLLRTRRIPFLGLTGTGLDNLDGLMLAGALSKQVSFKHVSSKKEVLELAQIAFNPGVRARLISAGEKAGVRVYLSSPDGPALRG